VVLINGNSASASEIVSGALQDLDRAVVVGRNSYGKGLVQTTKSLTYNTSMKITTAKYYLPSGRLIQRLDYGNKVNGKAVAVADSTKKTFETRNGRAVIDGEGIQPDVQVERTTYSKLTQALIRKNLIFQFANEYRSKTDSAVPPMQFDITDTDYSTFKSFLADKDYTYTSDTEKRLESLVEQAEEENHTTLLKGQLDAIEALLAENKKNDLQIHQNELKEILEYEIIKRYYFERGKVEITFDDDPDWAKVKEILLDNAEYESLLVK